MAQITFILSKQMASYQQHITRIKNCKQSKMSQKFYSIWERHLKCSVDFLTSSAAVWAPGRFGQSRLRNDERGERVGRQAGRQASKESRPAVWRLTVRSYSDGLSVVYQMTGAEVRHSAGGAVSLSPPHLFPYSRFKLVGSWNMHTSVSHGALASPPATDNDSFHWQSH